MIKKTILFLTFFMQSFFAYTQDNQNTENKAAIALFNRKFKIKKNQDQTTIIQYKAHINYPVIFSSFTCVASTYLTGFCIDTHLPFDNGQVTCGFLVGSILFGGATLVGICSNIHSSGNPLVYYEKQRKLIFTENNTYTIKDTSPRTVVYLTKRPPQDQLDIITHGVTFKFGETPERAHVKNTAEKILNDLTNQKQTDFSTEFANLDKNFNNLFDK